MSQRSLLYPDHTKHNVEILNGFLLDSGELLINYIDFSQKTSNSNELAYCYTTLIMTPNGWCKNPYHKEYDEYESRIICDYPVEYLPNEIGLEENKELIALIVDESKKVNPDALNEIEEIVRTFISLFPEKNLYETNTNMSITNLVRDLSAVSNISLVALEEAKKELYEYFSELNPENLQDKDIQNIIKQNGTIISRCAYEFGLKSELQAVNEEIVKQVVEEISFTEPVYTPEVERDSEEFEVQTIFKPVFNSGKPEIVIQVIPNGRRWLSEEEYNRLREMDIYVGKEELSESDYRMLCDKFEVHIDQKKPMIDKEPQIIMQPPIMQATRAMLEVTKHPNGTMSISQSAYESLIRQGFELNSRLITRRELSILEQNFEIVWRTAMEMQSQAMLEVTKYPNGTMSISQSAYEALIRQGFILNSTYITQAELEMLEQTFKIIWREPQAMQMQPPVPNNNNNQDNNENNDINNNDTKQVYIKESKKHYIVLDSRSNPENGNGTYNIASLLMGTCELIHYAETDDGVEFVSGEKYNKEIVDYLVETHRRLRTNCSNSCKVPIDSVPSFKIGEIEYEFVGSYRFQEMYPAKNVVIEKNPEDKDTKETLVEGFMGRRNMIVDGYKNFEGQTYTNDSSMKLTR